MNLAEAFAKHLKRNREARRMSQEELAAGAELDRTYISQLERGLKSPTLQTLEKLAQQLKIPPAALVGDAEVPPEARVELRRDYQVRDVPFVAVSRAGGASVKVPVPLLLQGVEVAHELVDQLYAFDLDIAAA